MLYVAVCKIIHETDEHLKVCYSSHQSRNLSVKQPMNSKLLVRYSSHVLNKKLLVRYSSHDLNNKPFNEQTIFDHLNTKQGYSDPHHIWIPTVKHFLVHECSACVDVKPFDKLMKRFFSRV